MTTLLFLAALLQLSAAKVAYKYEAQTLIAIPESGRDINVLRIEFNVAAAAVGSGPDLVVQVDPASVKVHNFTGPRFPPPEGIMDIREMSETSINAESKTNLATQLAKPILVQRNANGTLSYIRHDKDEPYWSVNLKKGALSLLQLNIQTDLGLYTVIEEDITGTCPSTYMVQSREHFHGHEHVAPTFLNVTKSRDYSKCVNRTILRHSFFSAISLTDEQVATRNIVSNAKFAYNISGTKALGGQLVVESATSEGQHIFSVYKPLSGSLVVYTRQRVSLLSINSDAAEAPESELIASTWEMALPNVATASSDKKFNDAQVVKEVAAAVAKLVDPKVDNVMKGLYLHRILEQMRGASPNAWDQITQGAIRAGPNHLKLLMDLAPSTGTMESLLKFQAELPRLTSDIKAQYFAVLGLYAQPSFEMISVLAGICENAEVRNSFRERKACLLAMASMINNRYFRNGHILKSASYSDAEKMFLEGFRTNMEAFYEQAVLANVSMQLLAVKCLGNLGSPTVIDRLASFATNESMPIVARVHAIRAFRRMPVSTYSTIQGILLPIFLDWHNDVEVRIAAYRGIMMTQPSQGVLDVISTALHNEHDEHIQTYVYSHLKVLAENPVAADPDLSSRARITLLGLTAVFEPGVQYSRYYRILDTYEDGSAGITADLSIVGTTRSMIPREVCLWIQGVAFDTKANLAHFCIRLQGIQKLLQKLVRIGGPVYPDFFSQLNLNQVEFEDYHGLIDVSIQGSEIQFMEIPAFLSEVLSNPAGLKQMLGRFVEALRTSIFKTVVLDSTMQVPSLIGLPVQQNNTFVLYLNVSLGTFGIVPGCVINPKQPCTITMQPQTQYGLGSQHSLGVDAGILQSKVLLHGLMNRERTDDRNWTINYISDRENSSLGFEAFLPRVRITAGHSEVIPVLITVDRSKKNLADQFYVREVTAWHAAAIPDINYDFTLNNTAKITGFLMGYNSSMTSCMPCMLFAGKSRPPYCGKIVSDFFIIPQIDAPDKVQIWYRFYGSPRRLISQNSFRSSDFLHLFGDGHESAEEMIEDLSTLSKDLSLSMQPQPEQASLEAMGHVEQSEDAEEQQADEFLARRKRSVVARTDKKPGYGTSRKTRPSTDDEYIPPRLSVNDESSTTLLEISGFRGGELTRKILISSKRSPSGKPKQYRRQISVAVEIGGRRVASVCGKALVQYPLEYVSLLAGSNLRAEPYWSYSAEVSYGASKCDGDNKIEFTFNLSRSDEQKLVTRQFREGLLAASKHYQVAMCRAELAKSRTYTWPCRHLFTELNEAHRLEITLKSDDVKKMLVGGVDLRNWVTAFLQTMRAKFWSNLKTAFVRDVKPNSKEIRFFGERNFQLPLLTDFKISTPESSTEFRNLLLLHNPSSLYFPMYYSAAYHVSGFRLPAVCAVQRIHGSNDMYVSTFDNFVYNVSVPTCAENRELNMLIAGDCSSASKFAVSANYRTATKQLEIRIKTAALPVSIKLAARTYVPEVYVDRTKVVGEEYQVISGGTGIYVSIRHSIITIRLDVGIFVKWTPDGALIIGASPLYSGLTCGWCGDYNGQSADELTMADGTITDDQASFVSSYVAGLGQCAAA